jgi:hypothetical protein
VLTRAVLAPLSPPSEFVSWADFIARTTPAQRRAWCARKAGKANGPRLMSGTPSGERPPSQTAQPARTTGIPHQYSLPSRHGSQPTARAPERHAEPRPAEASLRP